MSETVLKSITLSISFLGLLFVVFFFLKQKYNYALLLLILAGITLRIYTSNDKYLHKWDERYHALVAKNMMEEPFVPKLYKNPVLNYDYKNWTGNHIWVHKQPFPLWSIALSFKLFGVNELALRLPSIILTSIAIFLTFYIGSFFFNKRVGIIAAFFYAVNGLIIEMSAGRIATDHPDVFFLFFIELAVFFSVLYIKKQKTIFNILVGLSIGIAILCKWLPALIVLPIWALLMLQNKASYKKIALNFILIVSVATIIFMPWQIYIHNAFPLEAKWESAYNMKHILEVLDEQGGSLFFFLEKITINYGALIYLPLAFLIYKFFKNKENYHLLALIIWIFVPIIFFSLVKTKMQGYILFTAPALFIATAYFWEELNNWQIKGKLKYLQKILLIALLVLPIIYCIERTKIFQNKDRTPAWVQELKKIENENENLVLINCPNPIETMFYANCIAYSHIPTKEEIDKLEKEGYTVLRYND
ncbi:MAG: glycosyltransferase family 39 protein [Chitinophagales bacterium]